MQNNLVLYLPFAGLCGPIFWEVMAKKRFFKQDAYLPKFFAKLHQMFRKVSCKQLKVVPKFSQ